MRALVTGGAGFIGSTLVDRLLAEGHEVDVVDDLSSGSLSNLSAARQSGGTFSFHQLDICSDELIGLMARRRPEVVFHLAAQPSVVKSLADPVRDTMTNVLGTVRVLEGARIAGASKVVFAASGGSLYGALGRDELPATENAAHHPLSPYATSKKVALDYLSLYRELRGIEFTALALANVYGPRQDDQGEAAVVAIFASMLVRGEVPMINGDGEQTRDFVFVDDVVDAFARAAVRGTGLIANVGTGVETSVNELYSLMAKAAGVTSPAGHGPAREGDVRFSSLDPSRAGLRLGWKPFTPLAEGLRRVIEHQRQQQGQGQGQGLRS